MGPLLVKVVVGWLGHEGGWVDWSRVTSVEPGRITISGSAADLPMPGPAR
jgi:hypothetical protein